jgi:hypothetical protein
MFVCFEVFKKLANVYASVSILRGNFRLFNCFYLICREIMLGVEMFKKLVDVDVSVWFGDSLACQILRSNFMIYWLIVS